MSSVSLVRAKTFSAHVAFKFRHVVSKSGHFTHDMAFCSTTCVENVLMRTESYIAWKEMTISKDHVAEKPRRGWDLWRHGRP